MRIKFLFLFFVIEILTNCATVLPPPGGPEDKLPPRVGGVSLEPNSINQDVNLDVTIQFDEWIVQKPPNGSVAISPPIAGRIRLEGDGDKLRIYTTQPLDSNTTYTLTITNAIKDLQSNPLEKPFQILFSTGNILDSLKTNFSVYLGDSLIEKKKFPVVAFYPIGKVRSNKKYLEKYRDSTLTAEADTLPNITKEIPLYIAQADSLGKGTLQGMQAGSYLAAAFLDENNNQRLDATTEIAGVANLSFNLNDSIEKINFALGDLDTTSLTLDAATQRGNSEIELSFSRKIVLDSINCFLNSAKDTILPTNFYMETSSKNPVLIFENLKNDSLYTARCLYALDSLGRGLDSAINSAKFRFKTIPEDEILPTRLSREEPRKSSQDVLPDIPIKLFYNHPISLDTMNFRLYINDDSVKVDMKQLDAASFQVEPIWGASSKVKLVQVKQDTVIDTLFNEIILTQFNTILKLKLASLKGEISGGDSTTIIVLKNEKKEEWKGQCDSFGKFEIKGLPEGIYKIMYFKDLNGDERLTSGSVTPVQAGEPWAVPEEDLILPHGDDNILSELLKDLPTL